MSDDQPPPFLTRLFRACLLILGAVIALRLALDLLASIWPWLIMTALLVAVVYLAWRHTRNQGGRW